MVVIKVNPGDLESKSNKVGELGDATSEIGNNLWKISRGCDDKEFRSEVMDIAEKAQLRARNISINLDNSSNTLVKKAVAFRNADQESFISPPPPLTGFVSKDFTVGDTFGTNYPNEVIDISWINMSPSSTTGGHRDIQSYRPEEIPVTLLPSAYGGYVTYPDDSAVDWEKGPEFEGWSDERCVAEWEKYERLEEEYNNLEEVKQQREVEQEFADMGIPDGWGRDFLSAIFKIIVLDAGVLYAPTELVWDLSLFIRDRNKGRKFDASGEDLIHIYREIFEFMGEKFGPEVAKSTGISGASNFLFAVSFFVEFAQLGAPIWNTVRRGLLASQLSKHC